METLEYSSVLVNKDAIERAEVLSQLSLQQKELIIGFSTYKEAYSYAKQHNISHIYLPVGAFGDIYRTMQAGLRLNTYDTDQYKGQLLVTRDRRAMFAVLAFLDTLKKYIMCYNLTGLWRAALQWIIAICVKGYSKIFGEIVLLDLLASRIGHLAQNTTMYLLINAERLRGKKIIALAPAAANKTLLDLIGRQYFKKIITSAKVYSWINKNLALRRSGLMDTTEKYRDIDYPIFLARQERLNCPFSEKEEEEGAAFLQSIGVDKPYVCFHTRDSAYLNKVGAGLNWHYHDYRDAPISSYYGAVKWLAGQGIYCFRMGSVVEEPLADNLPPEVIDYATKYRSDFLDIYLMAHCGFFLGTGCGLTQVATFFSRPVAAANYPILEYTTNLAAGDIYIPKKLHHEKLGRLLTFHEILSSGIGRFMRTEEFESNKIQIISNDETEILELCQEMYQKLTGTWKLEDYDTQLQKRYFAITQDPKYRCYGVEAKIATTFLRKHSELLEIPGIS